jgi:hypothetical protein
MSNAPKLQVNKGYGWIYVSRATLDAQGDIDPTAHERDARLGNVGLVSILSARFPQYQFRLEA